MMVKTARKLGNKGFSLVEVIISVAIIAIAATPIIYSFMSAEKLNQKSRAVQEVTLIAQNTLESFKAVSTPDMINSLKGAAAGSSDIGIIGEVIESCEVKQYDAAGNSMADVITAPLGTKYVCKIKTSKYGKIYNIVVTLNASQYLNAGSVNSYNEPIIEDVDKTKKAYISDEILKYDSLIATQFIERATFLDMERYNFEINDKNIKYTDLGEDKSLSIHKNINIYVEKIVDEYFVTVMVKYDINEFPHVKDDGTVELKDESIAYEVYKNKFDSLSEIYLFYSSWYAPSDKVNIEVENEPVVPEMPQEEIDFYMIEQKELVTGIFNPGTNIVIAPDDKVNIKYIKKDEDYDTAVKKKPSEIKLYKIEVEVSDGKISPVVIESTKEE